MSSSMPRDGTTTLARLRSLQGLLCLLILTSSQGRVVGFRAQDTKASKISLFLSFKKDGERPRTPVELRPSVLQEVFVYVQNDSGKDQPVLVQLVGGDGKVEATSAEFNAGDTKATLVNWPAAPPAPATPGKPAALPELAMPVRLRVVDKAGTELGSLRVLVAAADSYLKNPTAEFQTESTKPGDTSNRLEVIVRGTRISRSRGRQRAVELELRPDRIRSLAPTQEKKGRYTGLIAADSDPLVLEAKDLKFEGNEPGFVYLNVDGVARAFTFGANFPTGGRPTTPLLLTKPILATSLPRYSRPLTAPLPLAIESGGLISENAASNSTCSPPPRRARTSTPRSPSSKARAGETRLRENGPQRRPALPARGEGLDHDRGPVGNPRHDQGAAAPAERQGQGAGGDQRQQAAAAGRGQRQGGDSGDHHRLDAANHRAVRGRREEVGSRPRQEAPREGELCRRRVEGH